MSKDTFETIDYGDFEEPARKPDDLTHTLADCLSMLNYKLLLFLFAIYLLVTSDVFIDKILGRFDNAVNHREATTKGTVIQGVFLVILYILADTLIKLGFI